MSKKRRKRRRQRRIALIATVAVLVLALMGLAVWIAFDRAPEVVIRHYPMEYESTIRLCARPRPAALMTIMYTGSRGAGCHKIASPPDFFERIRWIP